MNDNDVKVAFGVASICEDDSHIFMTDIDKNIDIKTVISVIDKIIQEYNLSNIYIVKSSNGFNAFSLDKLPLRIIYEINKAYPNVIDQKYNDLQFTNRGFYTLRIGNDKVVVDIRPSNSWFFKLSNAHRIFFNSIFGLNIDKHKCFDDFEVVRIIRYLNSKHGVDV